MLLRDAVTVSDNRMQRDTAEQEPRRTKVAQRLRREAKERCSFPLPTRGEVGAETLLPSTEHMAPDKGGRGRPKGNLGMCLPYRRQPKSLSYRAFPVAASTPANRQAVRVHLPQQIYVRVGCLAVTTLSGACDSCMRAICHYCNRNSYYWNVIVTFQV